MSTYLLALAVDGFTYVEGHTNRNIPVSKLTFNSSLNSIAFCQQFNILIKVSSIFKYDDKLTNMVSFAK